MRSSKLFLYIDPLKQGLKHSLYDNVSNFIFPFLYIDPLKQGLKRIELVAKAKDIMFLYIDPLKQGLKPKKSFKKQFWVVGFYT